MGLISFKSFKPGMKLIFSKEENRDYRKTYPGKQPKCCMCSQYQHDFDLVYTIRSISRNSDAISLEECNELESWHYSWFDPSDISSNSESPNREYDREYDGFCDYCDRLRFHSRFCPVIKQSMPSHLRSINNA